MKIEEWVLEKRHRRWSVFVMQYDDGTHKYFAKAYEYFPQPGGWWDMKLGQGSGETTEEASAQALRNFQNPEG